MAYTGLTLIDQPLLSYWIEDPSIAPDVLAALNVWDELVSFDFVPVASGNEADANFRFYTNPIDGLFGTVGQATSFATGSTTAIVEITIDTADQMMQDDLAVFVHEIGHGLGLAHDDLDNSIMQPTVNDIDGTLSGLNIEEVQRLYGPDGGDNEIFGDIYGTQLQGGDGQDTIWGEGGGDWIGLGNGADAGWGGQGNDTLYGNAGNDEIGGGDGDDLVYGGDGDDIIYGGAGADIIYAGAGNDTIYADALDTIVTGGQGGDLIVLV